MILLFSTFVYNRVNSSITVLQLAAVITERGVGEGAGDAPFTMTHGFPPHVINDGELGLSLDAAGLVSASVTLKKV